MHVMSFDSGVPVSNMVSIINTISVLSIIMGMESMMWIGIESMGGY